MKHRLVYIAMIFCLISNAYGEKSNIRISILGENMVDGSASSVGIYTGTDYFYGGLSLNHIKSSEVIQHSSSNEIYPVYFFFGLRAPWKLSPYIEAGIDLPEALIEDLLGYEDDEIDYYYSGGLEYSATDKFSILLYVKKYNFIFRENSLAPLTKIRPSSYGIGVNIRF